MSARSARQHKAWGAASEASKPQDHNPKRRLARGAGDRFGVVESAARHRFVSTQSSKAPSVLPTHAADALQSCHPVRRFLLCYGSRAWGSRPRLYAVVRYVHCTVEESQNCKRDHTVSGLCSTTALRLGLPIRSVLLIQNCHRRCVPPGRTFVRFRIQLLRVEW
jgi:hypothetical protein